MVILSLFEAILHVFAVVFHCHDPDSLRRTKHGDHTGENDINQTRPNNSMRAGGKTAQETLIAMVTDAK